MYFRIYNNMNIKVLTFIRPCYFVYLANWFHMIISFLHKPGQVSRCMALVPPVFRTGLWMACLTLTGQPLHKSRNWGSGMGQQPVLSYCIMWRDHVAWPCQWGQVCLVFATNRGLVTSQLRSHWFSRGIVFTEELILYNCYNLYFIYVITWIYKL